MTNWAITATTIYCDSVEDEVTLMVKSDGTTQCTGHNRYINPTGETARLMKIKSKQAGKQLVCEGLECSRVTQYRDRLMASEGEGTGRSSVSE